MTALALLLLVAGSAAPAAPAAPAVPAASRSVAHDARPPGVILVFLDGRHEEVAGYEVDGGVVRVVAREGGEREVPKADIDLKRSATATTEHLTRLERERARREAAALEAEFAARDEGGAARDGNASASGQKRPTLLLFTASWCGWCKKLEAQLADERVRAELARYDLRRVDFDASAKLASKYDVQVLPTLVVVDGKGKAVKGRKGYLAAEALAAWLQ